MFSVSSCEIELPRCRYNGPEGFANSFRNFIFHICGQNCISLVGFISLPYLPFTLTLPSCLQQSSPGAPFPPKSQTSSPVVSSEAHWWLRACQGATQQRVGSTGEKSCIFLMGVRKVPKLSWDKKARKIRQLCFTGRHVCGNQHFASTYKHLRCLFAGLAGLVHIIPAKVETHGCVC